MKERKKSGEHNGLKKKESGKDKGYRNYK